MMYIGKLISCIIVIVVLCSTNLVAQGVWDIKYVPIASVDSSFIGKEIRIDFKSSDKDTIMGNIDVFSIRKLLSNRDTIRININGKPARFREEWKFYVDHGVLKEQTLISIDRQEIIQIRQIFLKKIDESSLSLRVVTCNAKGKRREEAIVVKRNDVKGVLTRINVNGDFSN